MGKINRLINMFTSIIIWKLYASLTCHICPGLYPELVECAAGNGGAQVATPLKETLLHYADLLSPPLENSTLNRLMFKN